MPSLRSLLPLMCFVSMGAAAAPSPAPVSKMSAVEAKRLKALAQRVTILRDKWGIPHVYGKTDADAVFGLMYAQAEDDFRRVERNYINAMGRLAEVEGEAELYRECLLYTSPSPRD